MKKPTRAAPNTMFAVWDLRGRAWKTRILETASVLRLASICHWPVSSLKLLLQAIQELLHMELSERRARARCALAAFDMADEQAGASADGEATAGPEVDG